MSIDWRNRLERFRDTLRVLKESHETVYEHAVVQFDNPGDFHVGKFVPRFCVLGSNLIEQIIVPFADGRRHVHYIVSCDTDRSGHLVFRKQAAEMRATLERVPKSILPRFHFPSVGNGQTEGLLHWLYIVHWIGSERPRPSYGTYIQFLDQVDNFTQYADFSWWENHSGIPEFDVVPYLASVSNPPFDWSEWRQEYQDRGLHLPEVISSVLNKPVLLASELAVTRLLECAHAMSESSKGQGKRRKTKKREPRGTAQMLLSELWRHHGVETEEPVFEAADQMTLAAMLEVNQSTISRAFKQLGELLSREWSKLLNKTQTGNKRKSNKDWYDLACELKVIHEVLKHLDRPKSREYYSGDLRHIAERDRDETDDTGE